MPLRLDEIKEVQEIAMIAARTSALVAYDKIMKKLMDLEKRILTIEKSNSPTKQGKEKK